MSLVIAVALPLPVRISPSIINVDFGVFVCPESFFTCITASTFEAKITTQELRFTAVMPNLGTIIVMSH